MADKLKGKDFVGFLAKNGKMVPICCSRDMEIGISADTIEATKRPSSKWKSFIYGDRSYGVTITGLVIIEESITINDLYQVINDGITIPFVARNEENADIFFSGNILITDLRITGNNKDIMTYSMTALGDGELNTSNPYEINILTDGEGNPLEDGEGNMIYEQESGDLLPIDLNINC